MSNHIKNHYLHWKKYLLVFVFLFFLSCQAFLQPGTPVSFSFSLTTGARTSAGVYYRDGTLVKTLWNNVTYPAGSHLATWDRTDDYNRPAPDSFFNIKVVSNNVTYTWEGVVGNTSDQFIGRTVHHNYERIVSMAITGNHG